MQVQLFSPYQKQKQVIDNFIDSPHLFGVVVAPRGSGKTLLAANMLLYWALSKNNSKCGWISPIYNQAKSVFETIVKAAFDAIDVHNKAELTITFINGSTLKFLSADSPNSVRGFRFEYLVLDEVAYITESAITEAIMPTLNPLGKKCLMISTPRSKNHFYGWYIKGLDSNNVISFKIPLTECPYVKPELIEEARKSLPADIFNQEYNAEFTDAGNDVFTNLDFVCILDEFGIPTRSERYYIGVDTGITNDFTVCAIQSESGRVEKIIRTNGRTFEEIGKDIVLECNRWNIVGGFCETNGIGLAMYELLKPRIRKLQAFTTTQDSKAKGVRKLIYDIQEGNVEFPSKKLMPELYNEFNAYTYKIAANGNISFTHPSGMKDDIVDAVMLANLARNEQVFTKGKLYVGNSQTKIASQFGNSMSF